MIEPRTGNTLTCQTDEAANHYNRAIDFILGSQTGASDELDKSLALDKNFALAAGARYFLAKDNKDPNANTYKQQAQKAALDATEWEKNHIAMLFNLIENPGESLIDANQYLKDYPGDLFLASQLAGYHFFYGGSKKLDTLVEIFNSIKPTLKDDWAFLVRLGFATSEKGDRKQGLEFIERSLELRPESLYTIHALAHNLHDDGKPEESATLLQNWLNQHDDNAKNGQLYGHVQWHLTLAQWQNGQRDDALERYQTYSAPKTTTCGPVLTLADAGGFLLRDFLKTQKSSPLSNGDFELIDHLFTMLTHPFIALHIAGLYTSATDLEGIKKCEDKLVTSEPGRNRDLSLSLVTALKQFTLEDYQAATNTLSQISMASRIGIGGSNVERELVDLIEQSCKEKL